MHLTGLLGSAFSFVIRSIFKKAELPLIVLNNKEEAAYYLNDLEQMIGEQDVLFYPGSFRRPTKSKIQIMRMFCFAEVLNRINPARNQPLFLSEALLRKW
jgi:transcription-repair coupling factor (superfamily II helicase)